MIIRDKDKVIDSCGEAGEILIKGVPPRDLRYKQKAILILETFLEAANGTSFVPEKQLRHAQQQVLFLTSTDNLPLQVSSPVIWEGLTALRPAAAQFEFD